jgi:hypothetical protein
VRAAIAILVALAFPSIALAHGRPPFVERLAFDPNDPDRMIAQFSFGLLLTEDGGESFRWVCARAYGADSTREDPDLVVASDSSAIVATYDGPSHGDRSLCDWAPPGEGVSNAYAVDLEIDPHEENALWVVVSTGADPDRLARSEDGGRTWNVIGAPSSDVLIERIAAAPSDPDRLYLAGFIPQREDAPRRAFVLRSNDGGEHFEHFEIALEEGERTTDVVAVDPTNADRLFVRVRRGETDELPERLLYSDDGAITFAPIFALPAMYGFAISADGRTVWAGSALGGVWIAREGSSTFEQISDVSVRCIEARPDALWFCVDPYRSRIAIGRSTDDGAEIEEVLRLETVDTLVSCATCASTALACPAFEDDLAYDLDRYLGSGTVPLPMPVDAGIPAECVDASLPADAALDAQGSRDAAPMRDAAGFVPGGGACSCRAHPASSSSALFALLLLALARSLARRVL